MKFYIDFEATQPENEIIAIGVVAENGKTFFSLVKPQMSALSGYISNLTHISKDSLNNAPSIDEVMIKFDCWVTDIEPNIMKCDFISYGDDSQFIKATLPAVKDEHAFITMAYLMAKIKDYSKETFEFFHGSISLIHAFNYIQAIETKQKHNPLEDAMMLQKVYNFTQENEPLPCHPFNESFKSIMEKTPVKMPKGTFWCKNSNSGKKIYFKNCDEAIDWVIKNKVRTNNPERVHRERIMQNIMKATKKKDGKYCSYYWGRVKEE